MAFTVKWIPSAEARLTNIWIASRDRKSISDAANQIDSLLAVNPLDEGESRSSNIRVVLIAPLSIFYRVHPDDRRVDALAVHSFAKP